MTRLKWIHAAFVLFFTGALGAAPVIWGPATDTSGPANLIAGNKLHAMNGHSSAGAGAGIGPVPAGFTNTSYTILPAGVTATATAGGPTLRDRGNNAMGTATTGDAAFDNLVNSGTDPNGTTSGVTAATVTFSNLIPGRGYQIQVFYNDQRATTPGRVMSYGDGAGNHVSLAGDAGDFGQFAVGTFTAVGTTQTLTMTANGFANVHYNAIVIAEVSPPPVPPGAPANLTATGIFNAVRLDWDDNTQPGFGNFIVQRSTNPGGPYTPVPGATPTASAYTDIGLTGGTTYFYVVTAVNIIGRESPRSNEAQATAGSEAPPAPPNFIFIITDDQDTHAVGAYRRAEPVESGPGGRPYLIDTPNIDRLADEGMLFHSARIMGSNVGAVCTASRTSLMTGRSVWQNTSGMTAAQTFPGIFNRGVRGGGLASLPYATYRTCKVGNSYALANAEFTVVNDATKRGNTDGNGSEWHADRALDHINHWRSNHQPNGKPFLMYLGFSHPHDERNARSNPNLTGRYGCINTTHPASIVLNPLAPPLPANHLPAHPFNHGHLGVRDEISVPGVLQLRSEAVIRNEIGRNFASVDWIDRQLGRVLAKLEDPNGDNNISDSLLDNTYIIFTSDHGIAIGRHGLMGKQNLYEHSLRVPYIVRGPGIAAGSRTRANIYLHDTFPTLADLAGLQPPATIDDNDGRSFRNVLENAAAPAREHVYGLYSGGDLPGIRSITDGRFKLIKYDVAGNAVQITQLFDLETNPFELLPEHGVPNLATRPAYAAIRQRLEEELTRQRILNADPHAFLGDRTLLRFERNLSDSLPFSNNGTAISGTGGPLPGYSTDVPDATDRVRGEPNTRSLRFEHVHQHHVQIPHHRSLSFGNAPFTIEAWVKLNAMPTTHDNASSMPVVMKMVTGAADSALDYLFLAAAGSYGNATTYNRLTLLLGATPVFSELAIPDTGWHHISVAFDPVTDTVRFTLDGQVDTSKTSATGIANTGPLTIGAHFNTSGVVDRAFDGLIDELSITDGVLAPAELQPLSAIPAHGEFLITHLEFTSATTLGLTFRSNENFLYDIQTSATLEPGGWRTIRSFVPGTAGANATSQVVPFSPTEFRTFYRVLRL